MGLTVGTALRGPLPIYYKFIYNGAEASWGQPVHINDFQNSGESTDGKYRISDIDVTFIDRHGSYFATSFGNGTNGFGASLQVVAYLGGSMEYTGQSLYGTVWKRVGTAGAYTATLHTGKVYGVSYKNQQLRIRSKTSLALMSDMKWQYPITKSGLAYTATNSASPYMLGSYAFSSIGFNSISVTYGSAFYDFQNENTEFKVYAYILGTSYSPSVNTAYPLPAGRGTGDVSTSAFGQLFTYAGTDSGGTNFYDVNTMIQLYGSKLGTYVGTIQTDDVAVEYGYRGIGDAEAHKTSGSIYILNKDRLRVAGSFSGNVFYLVEPIRISGSPNDCYKTCMTGAMVSAFFGTSDIDSTTFNQSGTLTAFSYYSRVVYPNERGKVFDAIKEIIESEQGLFSVNTDNKFQFQAYGPRDLRAPIGTLGTQDIISSEITNLEEDYYNRFLVKYRYDAINERYGEQRESKTHTWSSANDKLLTIQSKWIQNPNEAEMLTQRLRVRYENTIPRINFTTPLHRLGMEIGELYQITDPNSSLSSKTVQIVGYRKGWTDKTIDYNALDAEAVLQRKGFSFWGTTGTLPGDAVSNSSVSGWGTSGTQANINRTLYGTQFSWW